MFASGSENFGLAGHRPQGEPRQQQPYHHRQLPGVEDDVGLGQVPGDLLRQVLGILLVLLPGFHSLGLPDQGPEAGFRRLAVLPENPVKVGVFHAFEVRDLDGDEPARSAKSMYPA